MNCQTLLLYCRNSLFIGLSSAFRLQITWSVLGLSLVNPPSLPCPPSPADANEKKMKEKNGYLPHWRRRQRRPPRCKKGGGGVKKRWLPAPLAAAAPPVGSINATSLFAGGNKKSIDVKIRSGRKILCFHMPIFLF